MDTAMHPKIVWFDVSGSQFLPLELVSMSAFPTRGQPTYQRQHSLQLQLQQLPVQLTYYALISFTCITSALLMSQTLLCPGTNPKIVCEVQRKYSSRPRTWQPCVSK